jgi:hypothetical protein
MDEAVWDVTVFTKNRVPVESEVADGFFKQVLQQARARQLLSADHFTVDGTLIEAWATRASNARTARVNHRMREAVAEAAIRRLTFMARSGAMTLIAQQPIQWRGYSRSLAAVNQS